LGSSKQNPDEIRESNADLYGEGGKGATTSQQRDSGHGERDNADSGSDSFLTTG
jgi:hypothetical protein